MAQISTSIYPILDYNVVDNPQETQAFIQLLRTASDSLKNISYDNFFSRRTQLRQILQRALEYLNNWLSANQGHVSATQMALYVKTSEFAIQEAALASVLNITPTLRSLFTELQAFAANSVTLSSNEQLKFNLLRGGDDKSVLAQFLVRSEVTFDSIVGFESVKARIRNLYSPLLEQLRPSRAKTLLLYGPPGTGKSYFISAMANYLEADFYPISAAQIYDPAIGVSEKRLNSIFEALRNYSGRAVLFFDEFEQIFPSRSNNSALELGKSLTVQLMELLSGPFGSIPGNIFIVAATNLLGALDPALRSRMTPQILVDLPNDNDKRELLQLYATQPEVDDIFAQTNNLERFSNRDLVTLGERILESQLAAINDATAFIWSETPAKLLSGQIGPGYLPVSPGNETPVPVPTLAENIPGVLNITPQQIISNKNLIQRPHPSIFLDEILQTINPISNAQWQAYKQHE